MFITMLISGPRNPKEKLDQPLVDELNKLWSIAGWSIAGKLACPRCMENTDTYI